MRDRQEHWANKVEHTSVLGIRVLFALYRVLGRLPFCFALAPVVFSIWASDSAARKASGEYLQKAYRYGLLSKAPGAFTSLKHMYRFAETILDKMLADQLANAGTSLPSPVQVKAERAYNAVPFATILFMLNLSAGLLLIVFAVVRMARSGAAGGGGQGCARQGRVADAVGLVVSVLSLSALTVCLALRWVVAGRVPMANGYETMLVMAWFVLLAGLAACRRFRIALPFGLLMSGFFLLVSHIGQMNPQITHVMPVLSSPLLSVHVSVIMLSFALLSLTFVCGVTALVLRLAWGRRASRSDARLESLALLSRLMLYPAVALLAVGVFVGAVWANVSWGTYWSWDAKEVWGLITLMVYAVAVHGGSLPFLRRPVGYHLYMTAAFLTLLMTYFGVNYFLGGMHSYA